MEAGKAEGCQEYGGMQDVLVNIYSVSGNKKYLDLSYKFNDEFIMGQLAKGIDRMAGKHSLINNVAAKVMKSKDPVGNSLTVEGKKGTIIGVFEDFHAIDLAGPLVQTLIPLNTKNRSTLLIRFSSVSYPEMIEKISRIYKRYENDIPFQPVLFRDLPDYSRMADYRIFHCSTPCIYSR